MVHPTLIFDFYHERKSYMLRITSFKVLTQFLRKIADTYCQADYAKFYQELQLRYEQQIFSAFLDGHPSWSIVQGETAYTLLLYHNWSFSRDRAENARQMTAIAQEIEQHYSDTVKMPISMEAAETVMRAVERTYLFSQNIWKEHHTLIFLLPATHKTEDSFCRCYQSMDRKIQADIYLLVPHKDFSATSQSILLHEVGHIINLALTGAIEVQPNDFQVVSALLHLNLDGVDCKEFFAHCFAMSLLMEPELTSADPFTMVPKTDKTVFRTYFTYKLKTAE